MEASILASVGKSLWRYLEANNADPEALFRKFGLDPRLIQEPRTRYPYKRMLEAWLEAAVITGNDNTGLDSARYCFPLDLNALGVTFLSSADLREALQRWVRYESVLDTQGVSSIVEDGERVDLLQDFRNLPDQAIRMVEDVSLSVLVQLCREGLGESLDPVEVAFSYPEPASVGEYFERFRCPLRFSEPVSRVTFSAEDVSRPFTAANRELAIGNDHILDNMVSELRDSDLVTRVKRAIVDELPSGTPAEDLIARRINLSGRTLQRRLLDQGTSFRQLILDVRRELAENYLADKSMPLAEISFILGFSDTSSFSRAFKRWTGLAPANYRSTLGD